MAYARVRKSRAVARSTRSCSGSGSGVDAVATRFGTLMSVVVVVLVLVVVVVAVTGGLGGRTWVVEGCAVAVAAGAASAAAAALCRGGSSTRRPRASYRSRSRRHTSARTVTTRLFAYAAASLAWLLVVAEAVGLLRSSATCSERRSSGVTSSNRASSAVACGRHSPTRHSSPPNALFCGEPAGATGLTSTRREYRTVTSSSLSSAGRTAVSSRRDAGGSKVTQSQKASQSAAISSACSRRVATDAKVKVGVVSAMMRSRSWPRSSVMGRSRFRDGAARKVRRPWKEPS
mmetsp:Transcript_5992/g.25068  ORF Transcript_5992/g.25068 Transcript_5992/m.25068 type:complete len:289 (-) Transcript_5992:782-1648(-)